MGQIKVEKNVGGIEGLYVIEPAVHGDARGYFMETYNEKDMKEAGIDIHFVQDNQSMSTKGVLRGLHAGGAIFTGTIACCSMTFPAASSLSSACQRMKLEYAIPFSEHHSRLVFPL